MEFFERISGARMHTALYKPYEFDWTTFTHSFFLDLSRFLMRCSRSLSGAFLGLLNSRVLKSRLASVGMLSQTKVINYGISGVIARSAGLRKDLRLKRGNFYGAYWYLTFRSFMGKRGDNLDRFLIRIKEVLESFRLVSQVISTLLLLTDPRQASHAVSDSFVAPSDYNTRLFNHHSIPQSGFRHYTRRDFTAPGSRSRITGGTAPELVVGSAILARDSSSSGAAHKWQSLQTLFPCAWVGLNTKSKFTGMEELIHHFRGYSEGLAVPSGIAYQCVEAPKGELGVMLVANGGVRPYRVKIRTPVSHNMHLVPSICAGYVFGDFVMTFCSLDIVLGEIDR